MRSLSYDIGNYDNAYLFFQRVLEIDERVSEPDSITVSSDYYNLADVSYNMYQFSKSLLYLLKALAIRKKYYSSEDIEIIVLIKLLAGVYVKLNRTDRAEVLYSWAADKFERNPETNILQLSTHYSDMAFFLENEDIRETMNSQKGCQHKHTEWHHRYDTHPCTYPTSFPILILIFPKTYNFPKMLLFLGKVKITQTSHLSAFPQNHLCSPKWF